MLRVALTTLVLVALTLGQISESDRVDCYPDSDVDETTCTSTRGCIYSPSGQAGVPWCYYPENFGYRLNGRVQATEKGFLAELVKSGPANFAPDEFNFAIFEAEFQTESRLRVKIHPSVSRYEVPIVIEASIPRPVDTAYDITFSEEPVFSFQVIRKSTGTVIFDSSLGGLTLADQYLQIGARLPSTNVYGLGEHEHPNMKRNLTWNTIAMFANDWAPNPDAGLYGVHPYYTVVEDDGNTHSVLLLNSNAQEITLTPAPGLIYRTIGGILDMYFFLGPTPENVVQQYTEAIGRQPIPPYWSLGFHLCRWGYQTTENMIAAYDRTFAAGIPQDSQWGDIDVMDRRLDFTYDTTNFAGLPAFIDSLHQKGQKFVVIVDPGVPTGEPAGSYPEFEDGDVNGVWVLAADGSPLLGRVWPDNPTHWPDFSNPVTQAWWERSISSWHDKIAFDGLWIDMNEPSNFVDGSLTGCNDNKFTRPPFVPRYGRTNINEKTLCMDAQHLAGLHYDTHSMYGWWEAIATKKAIRSATGSRGLVVSRSTFPGSGVHTAHWLGDNWAEWDNLKTSIIGMVEMNQFGIPLVGADICGFIGQPTEEMCARWHLLGAFYPFSRNHNEESMPDQDPAIWPSVAENARTALMIKYRLLPYLYTLFYKHFTNGNTVARPLWHEYPNDPTSRDIDEQFMWGEHFMIAPALREGQNMVSVYFPPDSWWFDYYTKQVVSFGAEILDIDCPLNHIPLYFKGGAIIPTQKPEMTTKLARDNDFELIVTLSRLGEATGDLYWDDGDSVDDDLEKGSHIAFHLANKTITSTVVSSNYQFDHKISKVHIWGLIYAVADVYINGLPDVCPYSQSGSVLEIDCGDQLNALSDFTIRWTEYCKHCKHQ